MSARSYPNFGDPQRWADPQPVDRLREKDEDLGVAYLGNAVLVVGEDALE